MAVFTLKYVEGSKYKYVSKYKLGDKFKYQTVICGIRKWFDSEREAALYVDNVLIDKGKNPVNILKKLHD